MRGALAPRRKSYCTSDSPAVGPGDGGPELGRPLEHAVIDCLRCCTHHCPWPEGELTASTSLKSQGALLFLDRSEAPASWTVRRCRHRRDSPGSPVDTYMGLLGVESGPILHGRLLTPRKAPHTTRTMATEFKQDDIRLEAVPSNQDLKGQDLALQRLTPEEESRLVEIKRKIDLRMLFIVLM